MPPLIFDVGLFDGVVGPPSEADVEASEEIMLLALHFLAKIDSSLLKRYPNLPRLYNSGLPYHHDWGVELWWSILRALQVGHADCKVVLAILLSEKWARAHIPWSGLAIDPPPCYDTPVGPTVEPSTNEDPGYIEDPSRVLGHGWELGYATTNRRPATAEFQAQLAELLGHPSRSAIGTLIPPRSEAGQFFAGAVRVLRARREPRAFRRAV